MLDVLIIGAGVSGCAAARELSRCKADILVLDKEEDVYEPSLYLPSLVLR